MAAVTLPLEGPHKLKPAIVTEQTESPDPIPTLAKDKVVQNDHNYRPFRTRLVNGPNLSISEDKIAIDGE
jgi:hypothetical protein